MKNLFLISVIIFCSICSKAQSNLILSENSLNKNLLETKISNKIILEDVVYSKQPLIIKNKSKKSKSFEKIITIDNNYVYNYIVFYNNSKLNSIVKLNPISYPILIDFGKQDKLYDLKNLDIFGKKAIALDEN
jgi:hypothetical protein